MAKTLAGTELGVEVGGQAKAAAYRTLQADQSILDQRQGVAERGESLSKSLGVDRILDHWAARYLPHNQRNLAVGGTGGMDAATTDGAALASTIRRCGCEEASR